MFFKPHPNSWTAYVALHSLPAGELAPGEPGSPWQERDDKWIADWYKSEIANGWKSAPGFHAALPGEQRRITKSEFLLRLKAAGKLSVFLSELAAASPDDKLMFDQSQHFMSDDATIRSAIVAAGLDPDEVLAD